MATIAVAGATGVVGRHVVAAVTAAGHRAVPLSRSSGVDVTSPQSLDAALDGVDAVIDVLNVETQSGSRAVRFFEATTSALLAAEQANGIGHHVALSIVGIEAAPGGYYAGKVRQEELVKSGPVPWTILRSTQFHDFAAQLMDRTALGPLALVPSGKVRPVAAREVGATLAELAAGDPSRATVNLRGPRDEDLLDMARRTAAARPGRRVVVPVWLPGQVGRAMRSGALRGDGSAREGTQTFADWLRDG